MTDIFKKHAADYYAYGVGVVPMRRNSKASYIKYSHYNDNNSIPTEEEYEAWEKAWPNANISILCGERSGITLLDIDTNDKDILKWCPQSPLIKFGQKGETRFFRSNNEPTMHYKNPDIDILGNKGITFAPPSVHYKTGKPYIWKLKDLWFDNLDDFPTLPPEFLQELAYRAGRSQQQGISEITPSDGTRCNHGSHIKINSMINAALHNGDTPQDILKAVLDFDEKHNPDVSYFLCPSRSEFRSKNKVANAMQCISKVIDSLDRKGEIGAVSVEKPVIKIVTATTPPEKTSYKKHKYPHLDGVGQIIFKDIYKSSPKPRTILTEAATLSLLSLAIGNRLCYEGTFANLYNMIVCPSGGGKDTPMKYVGDILHKADRGFYIGESAPSSDTAILMNLSDVKNQRIDIIDEASKLFMAMADKGSSTWQNMANIYQELFTATGSYYNGKSAYKYKNKNNTQGILGRCKNPFINLLCAMTISDFTNHFSSNLMDKGLGGRFLYFADDEEKTTSRDYKGVKRYDSVSIFFLQKWLPEIDEENALSMLGKIKPKEIKVANPDKIRNQILDIEQQCLDKVCTENSMRSLLVRHHVMIKKLAMIKAVDSQYAEDPEDIIITQKELDWAIAWGESYLKNIDTFFNDHLHDSRIERVEQIILYYIKLRNAKGSVATKQYLAKAKRLKKIGVDSSARNKIIRDLLEQGVIKEAKDKNDVGYILGDDLG